jgi:hypothetical protein
MDDVHLSTIAGEIVCFLHRGIATPNNGKGLALEEGAVAYRAIRDALAGVLELTRHSQLEWCAACGEDHRWGLIDPPHRRRHLEDPIIPANDRFHRILPNIGPKLHRMRGHPVRQLAAEDVLEADIIVDPFRVQELATGHTALEQHRTQ